ncbi:CHASE domain-containing protein [Oxalobacteraceae bacterium A2-2]
MRLRVRAYAAFLAGLSLTAWTAMFVMDAQQQQVRNEFQRDADKVMRDTSVRLQTYFDILHALKGMVAVDGSIDRGRFTRFVRELRVAQRYPGFQAIQFVRVVPEDQLERYTAAVRQDTSIDPGGYPGFRIHPVTRRQQHYIIEYTEPLKGNENAFGLDLAGLPIHLRALEMGAASGQIVGTERITLVQDSSGEAGFIARAPVYRNDAPLQTAEERRAALLGFVAIVFRVNTLMREVIDTPLLEHLRVRIDDAGYDGDGSMPKPGVDTLLFDSQGRVGASGGPALVPGLETRTTLLVGQRRWQLHFEGKASPRYSRDQLPVMLIVVAGVIISALIAALLSAFRRVVATKHGLEHNMQELAQQKAAAEKARADLAAVLVTLERAQSELITSEKMASLGALVAGVAHELNTPIGNSLLTASALSDMVNEFEQRLQREGGLKRSALEAHLAEARNACYIMTGSLTKAADLVNSFKQVAVDQSSGQRRQFLLDEVVSDTLATYAAQMRRRSCSVQVDVEPGLRFDSYPGSLTQVLTNLIANSLLHGFDGRECGAIRIVARRQSEDKVRLEYSDDGVGMTQEVLRKVYDPFFTTKLGQGGSGLGMNIVYNIVTGVLKGSIQVGSAPGQGTTVTLVLPRSPA